jgi:DNA-binding GntR family transcriptional regulator
MTKCGNDLLVEMVYSLVSRINFLRAQSLMNKDWRHVCIEEIEEMIDAIRANKPAAARRATRRHISSACQTAMETVRWQKPKADQGKTFAADAASVKSAQQRRAPLRVVQMPKRTGR